MGVFNIFKKIFRNDNENIKNEENKKNQSNKSVIDDTYLKNNIINISNLISHNDSEVIDEINNLMNNKDNYIKNNERGIDEKCSTSILFWLIMVDTLEKYNYVCERDWQDEFDDFIYFISNLKTFNLDINNDIFNKNESITEWCKKIDNNCDPKCIGCIDIDSDSFVLFVSNNDEINELKRLAREISKKIEYAKNC